MVAAGLSPELVLTVNSKVEEAMTVSERIQWAIVAVIGLLLIIKSWRNRPWRNRE